MDGVERPPPAIVLSIAGSTDTSVTLRILGPELKDPQYLHNESDIIDPTADQQVTTIDGGIEILLPLVEDEAAPEVLEGILLTADKPHQSLAVNTAQAATAATPTPAEVPAEEEAASTIALSTQQAIDDKLSRACSAKIERRGASGGRTSPRTTQCISPRIDRAISSRWISLVPSPMGPSRASRYSRSTSKSSV